MDVYMGVYGTWTCGPAILVRLLSALAETSPPVTLLQTSLAFTIIYDTLAVFLTFENIGYN